MINGCSVVHTSTVDKVIVKFQSPVFLACLGCSAAATGLAMSGGMRRVISVSNQIIRELASKIRDTVEEIYNLHYLNACCGNWQNCSNTYIRWDSTIFILLPF